VNTDRIPGFAICGRCGARHDLAPCWACGLITCSACRGDGQCAVCRRERQLAHARAIRQRTLRRLGHRLGVAACVVATGLAAVGAALIPEPPGAPGFESDAHNEIVARGEVRFVGEAIDRWSLAHAGTCPPSLGALRSEGYLVAPAIDPWGEPLLYGCVEQPHAFVVLSKGPDHRVGTHDDVVFATP
jgi:hypothetical protein